MPSSLLALEDVDGGGPLPPIRLLGVVPVDGEGKTKAAGRKGAAVDDGDPGICFQLQSKVGFLPSSPVLYLELIQLFAFNWLSNL